jgi:tetratricopeptide (TPR) repeat protein
MNKPKLAAALLLSATFAGALGLTLGARSAHAADQDKAKQHQVSRDFFKPLKAAQEDELKGQFQQALTELDKARALPKPTPWDTHMINELALAAYAKTNDLPDAAKTMDAIVDDGFAEPTEVNRDLKVLAQIYYQLKDYGKAADYGVRAIKAGDVDDNTYILVSQAYYLGNDLKNAYQFTEQYVNGEIQKGQTPKEASLELALGACAKLNDAACESHSLEQLVTYYPKPEYWRELLGSDPVLQSKQAGSSDVDMLNVYRLTNDVNAMQTPGQYNEMAQFALEFGSPGEAQQVLEKGLASNVFTDADERDHAESLLATAKKQARADQISLPKLTEEAAASTKGDKDVAVGIAYLSYNQYDKAADLLNQGLMKGGVRNPAQARLLLGIAQLKAGKKDDALKTFQMVKGDPALERLADLWSLHARSENRTVASR